MNSSPRTIALLALSLTLTPSACLSQTLTFQEEEFVVIASGAPDTPFVAGVGNTTLTIDQSTGDFGPSGMSDALIRFNDFDISPFAAVRSATLSFQTTSATDGPVNIYQMTVDWDENSTWNTLGGDGLTVGSETTDTALDSLVDLTEGLIASFDVTDAVAAFAADPSANFGFGVINDSTDGWDVATVDSETAVAPFLTVEIEVPAPARLEIDRTTGFGKLVSVVEFEFEARGYELLSDAGDLDATNWEATNLAARGVDALDPSVPGQRWDTVNAASDQLFETFLFGGTAIGPDGEQLVGRVVDPSLLGESLPELAATLVTTNFLGGSDEFNTFSNVIIEYVDFETLPGDYNADGSVDAADYTVWRDGLGEAFVAADYNVWAQAYGATAAAAAIAAPEPSSTLLGLIALAAVLKTRR